MTNDEYRPFADALKGLGLDTDKDKKKPANKYRPASKTAKAAKKNQDQSAPNRIAKDLNTPDGTTPDSPPVDDGDRLFLQAMSGVKRGPGKDSGKNRKKTKNQGGHQPFAELGKKPAKDDAKNNDKAPKNPSLEKAPPTIIDAGQDSIAAPDPLPAPLPDPLPDEDMAAFDRAMAGIKPLDGGAGREVPQVKTPPPGPTRDSDAAARKALRDLVAGKVEFDVAFAEEFMSGRVMGLDPRIYNRLKAGALAVEDHLDLHGMNSLMAFDAVVDFIRKGYTTGKRCLLLVPGRGLNSPQGLGVIRRELMTWLTRDPLKRVVLAFVTAQPRHGGAGALYVLLRKYKKSMGKIQWDREPPTDI